MLRSNALRVKLQYFSFSFYLLFTLTLYGRNKVTERAFGLRVQQHQLRNTEIQKVLGKSTAVSKSVQWAPNNGTETASTPVQDWFDWILWQCCDKISDVMSERVTWPQKSHHFMFQVNPSENWKSVLKLNGDLALTKMGQTTRKYNPSMQGYLYRGRGRGGQIAQIGQITL